VSFFFTSGMKHANGCRYGMVLAKDKNEEEAMRWLIRSVHLYPMNWGCWLEMTSLISRVEDVSAHPVSLNNR
jgi:anaphase-promoting complex subunit 8